MKKIIENNRGFTLIETIVALTILAIGLVAVIGLQTASFRMNQKNKIAEVGRDVLVSEIEQIMPLSNLQLRDKNTVGNADNRSSLGMPFSGTLFTDTDSATPVTPVLPTNYDYVRWKGVSKVLTTDDKGNASQTVYYVVKTVIDKKYLLQDVLARGQVTVYWPHPGLGVDYLETTFFMQRK